jgi:SAM-dependent methyltransferase
MPDDVILFPGRFAKLADIYIAGRPTYPRLLARRVADLVGLDGSQDVLDLGTGPGFLARDFRPFARSVTGIDPEPEMLRVAAAESERFGLDITFLRGSSNTLSPSLGTFRLVTIGRAFHWMDRSATLESLERLIDAHGAVALFQESYPNVPENEWFTTFDSIVDRYATHDPAKEQTATAKTHEAVLLHSAFSHLERMSVLEVRKTPVDRIVDRALSFARAWYSEGGPRPDALAQEVRAGIAPFARDGAIEEVLEGTALIARRPFAI